MPGDDKVEPKNDKGLGKLVEPEAAAPPDKSFSGRHRKAIKSLFSMRQTTASNQGAMTRHDQLFPIPSFSPVCTQDWLEPRGTL